MRIHVGFYITNSPNSVAGCVKINGMKIVALKKRPLAVFCLLCGGAFAVTVLHFPREEPASASHNIGPVQAGQPGLAGTISWTPNSPPPVRLAQSSSSQERENAKRPDFMVQLSVHPQRSPLIASQIMLAGGAGIPTCKTYISLQINGAYDKDNYRIRFRAEHTDGTPAGQINGPGKEDDIVHWKNFNDPYVPFRSDSRTGPVQIWAEAIDTNGKVVTVSNRHEIKSLLPDLRVTYGQWKPSSEAGTWERRIYVVATTKEAGILDFTGTPVQLKLAPVTSVHTVPHASYFAKTSGVTVGEWINISARITDDMPFTGTQYWKETPTGTRQLNAYRVEAVIDKARLFALPPHHSSADKIPSTNKEAIP